MHALDGVSTRSLAVSGVDLLHRSNAMDLRMGTVQGIYSWGSALEDGDLMRRRFRVGCGCFFLGGRGRGRGVPGRVLLRSFRRTAGSKQPVCFIYYMLSSGGCAATCLQAIAKGGSSILGRPGQTRALFGFDNPST
jgi:hypothetical protein